VFDAAIDDLEALLIADFHKKLLRASLRSLEETLNPLAFNNFCAGFRELIRHVLSDLAPDAEIKACAWYEPDKSSKSGITRAHAMTYVIQGGLPHKYVADVLKLDVSDERRALIAAVNLLNKYTHVNASTFDTDVADASEKAERATRALGNVLTLANQCRSELASALQETIQNEVVELAISEMVDSIDGLASHHCVENIDVEEVSITKVDSEYIHIQASGTIGVELQWGSNSDVRRGGGAVGNDSFPFTCDLLCHVDTPDDVAVVENTLCVDTSSWWEGYYDET